MMAKGHTKVRANCYARAEQFHSRHLSRDNPLCLLFDFVSVFGANWLFAVEPLTCQANTVISTVKSFWICLWWTFGLYTCKWFSSVPIDSKQIIIVTHMTSCAQRGVCQERHARHWTQTPSCLRLAGSKVESLCVVWIRWRQTVIFMGDEYFLNVFSNVCKR